MLTDLIFGLILLFFGKTFYWVLPGILGFIYGFEIAGQVLQDGPFEMVLAAAAGCGLAGSLLALLVRRIAIAAAGFFSGAYVLLYFYNPAGWATPEAVWIPALIGGIAGLILVLSVFDWAVVILSALTGATLIVKTIPLERAYSPALLIVIMAIGIFVQAKRMKHT